MNNQTLNTLKRLKVGIGRRHQKIVYTFEVESFSIFCVEVLISSGNLRWKLLCETLVDANERFFTITLFEIDWIALDSVIDAGQFGWLFISVNEQQGNKTNHKVDILTWLLTLKQVSTWKTLEEQAKL